MLARSAASSGSVCGSFTRRGQPRGSSTGGRASRSLLNLLEVTFEFLFDCEDGHSLAKGCIPKLTLLAPREKSSIPALRRAA